MENESDTNMKMYVTDPVLIKEGITKYMSYTLCGSHIQETLNRRYKDFDSLRHKLAERWPGIYIPKIPPKKVVGAVEKEFVENRKEMLNRFCDKLSNIPYLFESEEMKVFLENVREVPKAISSIPQHSYEELLKKYSHTFTNYDDNFDTIQGKANQAAFLQVLKSSHPRIKSFKELIKQSKDHFLETLENETGIINLFSLYEKDCMSEICDENKLIFFNMQNNVLSEKINNLQVSKVNPYNKLYDDISDDLLNTEAMIEALTSLNELQNTLDKVTKNCISVEQILNELQAGKTNIKALFRFKKKEDNIQSLTVEKEELERNKADLDHIIRIATHNMENEIANFKVKSIGDYYRELKQLESEFEQNNIMIDDIWSRVLEDQNVKIVN